MLRRLVFISALLLSLVSNRAMAVYFPAGIDWTNPSQQYFVLSMYLNVLGRAPDTSELRSMSQRLAANDNSESRLQLFRQFLGSREYQRLFTDNDDSWQIFRAPDMNYNRGNGSWRYQAAMQRPSGFQSWQLSSNSTRPVAEAMAGFYQAYCYAGIPCVQQPEAAARRIDPVVANQNATPTHACADESAQIATFEWIAFNGTTYPKGTDANTLCMGDHYYQASGTLLQRFQCQSGYTDCRRDSSRDIRAERTGVDDNANPAMFFRDGSRLVLTNQYQLNPSSQNPQMTPQIVSAANQHECADPSQITRYYQWNGANGTSEAAGVGTNVICMDDYYYLIEGMTLKHHSCERGYTNCRAAPEQDVVAQRRTRVEGRSALQFRNGTTLSLLDKAPDHNTGTDLSGAGTTVTSPVVNEQPAQRLAGQHDCGVPTRRLSQFRWLRSDGSSIWPDGVDGTVVCMDNAFYNIENFVLRHHQCSGDFQNCQASRGKDLIALRESIDSNGLRTLTFANGDQLSLISK